jgi:hypothetical protein
MTKQRKPVRAGNRKRSTRAAARTRAKAPKPAQSPAPTRTPVRRSKKASILDLLQRPQGAAISELTAATGWQSHSVRAVLTGFRKEGKGLHRDKNDLGVTRYRISGAG